MVTVVYRILTINITKFFYMGYKSFQIEEKCDPNGDTPTQVAAIDAVHYRHLIGDESYVADGVRYVSAEEYLKGLVY